MAERSYGGAADGLRCVCVADVGDGERSQVRRGAVSARVLVLALAELFLCVRACAGGRWSECSSRMAQASYGGAGNGCLRHRLVERTTNQSCSPNSS